MKKVAIILSNINKALAFEWIADALHKDMKLHFILLFPGQSELEKHLRKKNISVFPIAYTGKRDIIRAVYKIRQILRKEKIDIVHAHLLDAGLAGLYAAKLAGIKKRIYTRHHATSHHVYHPHAVRYDRLINRLASHLVATSKNVKQVLMEKEQVAESKIQLIHHGFDLDAFGKPDLKKVQDLQQLYNPDHKAPVIGVISRYIELKGIQYIIPAFRRLLTDYPNAYLILANASGKYRDKIRELLAALPASAYREIAFENDLVNLYPLFNVHVHVPVDLHAEAFGQTYIEALASGIPSVFTLSGVAPEIIKNDKNAIVVPYKNEDAIYDALKEILQNNTLRNTLTLNGKENVREMFGINRMISALKNLYEN